MKRSMIILLAISATLICGETQGAELALNFASAEPSTAFSEVAGAAGVNGTDTWENLINATGNVSIMGVTVIWDSNNTWSSRGAENGEFNNTAMDGDDRNLMTGYLDTNASDPTTITVSGLANGTYDVYVYIKGGVNGRGGDYTIGGLTLPHVDESSFDGVYEEGATGDYLVFPDVSGTGFTLTVQPTTGVLARAPVNALEVIAATVPTPVPAFTSGGLIAMAAIILTLGAWTIRHRQQLA